MKKHTKSFIALLVIIGGLALALITLSPQNATVSQGQSKPISSPIAGIKIGGPYALTDHTGTPRTDQDYADQYKLIYFGFTYCPAICPTELAKISAVMTKLPPEITQNIQPIFITIDPERDTQNVMKDYVSLFHPKLIGLTGTTDQIKHVKKQYRVFAKKVEDESLSEYTMDHSSYIYFMSPEDTLLGMYRMKDEVDYIIQDITKQIK